MMSMIGNQVTIVATLYQVYDLTHSTFWSGAVSLVQLPLLIAGSLWGGAAGDRIDRKKILVVCAVMLALLSSLLAVNANLAHPSLLALFVLSALSAGVAGYSNPARNAAIPRLVSEEHLVAAYSLNQTVIQFSTIVGPVLAGLILARTSVAVCFALDAVSFLALIAATVQMAPLRPLATAASVSILQSIRNGFGYVRTHTIAQAVYLIDLNAMIFGSPRSLFPAFAHSHLSSPRHEAFVLGLLVAAPGIGALLGALTTGWVERVTRRGRAIVFAVTAWGVAIALFGFTHSLPLAVFFLAVAGWADVISAVLRNTVLQSRITDDFRSRVSSIQMAVVTGGPRLGDFEAGVVAELTSPQFSVVSGGVAAALGALTFIKWKPDLWRETATGP